MLMEGFKNSVKSIFKSFGITRKISVNLTEMYCS